MLQQEISMTEMIQYLAGEAPADLRDHIEMQIKNDPEFAEEVEMWREYKAEQDEPPTAPGNKAGFCEAWHTAEVEVPVSHQPAAATFRETPIRSLAPEGRQVVKKTSWMYAAVAVAAAVVLLVIVFWPNQPTDYRAFAAAEIDAGIENLIGVTMGSEEDFDRMLRERIDADTYTEALTAIDSLLATQPGSAKYRKLQALILAADGQASAAQKALEALRRDPSLGPDDYCKTTWQLAMIHYHAGNQAAFAAIVQAWNDPAAQVPCHALSPENNQRLTNMLQAPGQP